MATEPRFTDTHNHQHHCNRLKRAVHIDTHDWFRLRMAFEPELVRRMWDDAIHGESVRLFAQQQTKYETKREK